MAYTNVNEYLKYIKDNFKLTGNINAGRFYHYFYNFSREYPWKELKFYDFFPLTFIFERDGKYALGLNFHHLSEKPRHIWLDRVRKLSKQLDEQIKIKGLGGRPVYKIYNLDYPRVYKILMKSKIGIRRYRLDRISQLRAVDLAQLDETMKWISKTYMGVTIKQIQKRYLQYKPRG